MGDVEEMEHVDLSTDQEVVIYYPQGDQNTNTKERIRIPHDNLLEYLNDCYKRLDNFCGISQQCIARGIGDVIDLKFSSITKDDKKIVRTYAINTQEQWVVERKKILASEAKLQGAYQCMFKNHIKFKVAYRRSNL